MSKRLVSMPGTRKVTTPSNGGAVRVLMAALSLAAGKENLVAGGDNLQAQLRKLESLHSKGRWFWPQQCKPCVWSCSSCTHVKAVVNFACYVLRSSQFWLWRLVLG